MMNEGQLTEMLEEAGIKLIGFRVAEGGSAHIHRGIALDKNSLTNAGEAVAVKEYKESLLSEPGQLARIKQEARVGSRLDHPNVNKARAHERGWRGPPPTCQLGERWQLVEA